MWCGEEDVGHWLEEARDECVFGGCYVRVSTKAQFMNCVFVLIKQDVRGRSLALLGQEQPAPDQSCAAFVKPVSVAQNALLKMGFVT